MPPPTPPPPSSTSPRAGFKRVPPSARVSWIERHYTQPVTPMYQLGEEENGERGNRKVVLRVHNVHELGLPKAAIQRLRVLVEHRLKGNTLRLVCERFPQRALNKRYLAAQLDSIIEESLRERDGEHVPLPPQAATSVSEMLKA
jgi:hypothetical protein